MFLTAKLLLKVCVSVSVLVSSHFSAVTLQTNSDTIILTAGTEVPDANATFPKQTNKRGAKNTSDSSKKRKKSKDSSDSEDEEENSDVESDSSGEYINGKASGKGRGKGARKSTSGGKGTGRGRPSTNKTPQSSGGKTGKRGRPRKS